LFPGSSSRLSRREVFLTFRSVESRAKGMSTTYDALGRVTRESNRGLATQYEYDQNGNRTLMVDPSGDRFTCLYDELDARLKPRDPFRDSGP